MVERERERDWLGCQLASESTLGNSIGEGKRKGSRLGTHGKSNRSSKRILFYQKTSNIAPSVLKSIIGNQDRCTVQQDRLYCDLMHRLCLAQKFDACFMYRQISIIHPPDLSFLHHLTHLAFQPSSVQFPARSFAAISLSHIMLARTGCLIMSSSPSLFPSS